MLKEKLIEIIDNKVNNFVWKLNWAIFQEIKSNPELYSEKNYIIKIPVNKVIEVWLDEQEIWNWNDGFWNEWENQFFDDYEKDFEVSELWKEIGKKIEEYYASNGYELKIIKQEWVIPYYVDAITGNDSMTYEAEWSTVKEERKKRVNYFWINKNWKEIYEKSPLFIIDSTIEDELSSRFRKIIEDIDKIIIDEVSQKDSFNSLNLKFRASKIFLISELSWIDDVTDEEYTSEEDFSRSIFWLAHRMRIEEYYTSQWFRLLLQFDSEFIYDNELDDAKCIWPYNFIQIEKMDIALAIKSKLLFLDTEVHDLKSPILIQLAYKDSDTGESFSEYYSTGGVPISDGAMGVHHIAEQMIEWKDLFKASWDKSVLQNLLNEKILVAHNAKFDIWVLKSVGMDISRSICTLKIAHYLYPSLENYKLQTLRYTFKLELEWEINPHDAMSDVLVLEKLFWKFYEELGSKLGTTDPTKIIEEMITISSRPILLDTITFWKHKWDKWRSLPKSYLDWILNKSDLRSDEDIAYTCRYYTKWEDKGNLTENMFEKAWEHPRNKIPAIEEHGTEDTNMNPDHQSGTKIFGIFLILIVVMVLISVLF